MLAYFQDGRGESHLYCSTELELIALCDWDFADGKVLTRLLDSYDNGKIDSWFHLVIGSINVTA